MNKCKWTSLAIALAMSASLSHATTDVDIDNDGLIEIATLQELDLMRYDLAGTSLNGDSTGCPATGCNGYELVNDLDFDTNGNGVADSGDLFWNNGEGWESIGGSSPASFSRLEGNNHTISSLYVASTGSYVGLFGFIYNTDISNLRIYNAEISGGNSGVLAGFIGSGTINNIRVSGVVDGYKASGLLAGHIQQMAVSNVKAEGDVSSSSFSGAWSSLGGIAGESNRTSFDKVEFEGDINANQSTTAGGIVGFSYKGTEIKDALVINSSINARESAGGIVGDSFEDLTIENSLFIGTLSANYKTAPIVSDLYTYQDVTTVVKSYWDSEVAGIYSADYGEARTTSELQCSMMPGDAMCDVSLYAGWNETIWDFGTSSDYPVLR
jgi:hypothetical protein